MHTTTPGLIIIKAEEFNDPALAKGYAELELPDKWELVKTDGDSQGDKLREIAQRYMDKDWAGLLGDDQVVQTEHWDLKLIEWLKGWNLVSCYDDGWQINERGGRIAGTILYSGELLRTIGYIYPPGMHHVYLDDILEDLGQHSGCWSFKEHACPDVTIAHLHVDRGMGERDETYDMAYGKYASEDHPVWHAWRTVERERVINQIRELRQRLSG